MKIPEGWPTEEMLFAAREACDDMFQTDFIRAFKAALAAAPTAPAQEDAPVAWVEVKDSHNGPYEFHGQELLSPGKHNLYTRQDNSELRKAAEEYMKITELTDMRFLSEEHDQNQLAALKNLRAALEGQK